MSCRPARTSSSATRSGYGPEPTDLCRTSQEFLAASWAAAAGGGQAPIDLGAAAYRSIADVRGRALEIGVPWWTVSPFATDAELAERGASSSAHEAESYRGDLKRAFDDVRAWLRDGWRVVLVTEGHGSAHRMVEVLRGEDIAARLDESLDGAIEPAVVHVTTGGLDAGFTSESLRLAVLTESDLTGTRSSTRDMRRMPSKRRGTIDPLTLKAGDVVVHEQHGVGRYVDLVQRTVAGATREYLVIEYAPSKRGQPGDRLYVPTDSLDQVTKYVGGEAPSLDKMGGGDWAKRKGRARKAVREIAAELIRLYAARMSAPGHAFAADTPWQRELEDAFAYVETPDQLAAIDEVKADMQAPHPMDRVICGDVGYGKTEIAVRAAFKAVMDGKQAAVLVPTTLARAAALRHVHRAVRVVPGDRPRAVAVPDRPRAPRDPGRPRRRHRRRRDRHPSAASAGDVLPRPRPRRRRRGAAVRRRAQGVPEAAADLSRRADDVGDADPADPGDVDHRHPRDERDPDPARGAAPGADLRRRLRRAADLGGDPARAARARARSSTSTTGSSRSTGAASRLRDLVPEAEDRGGARSDARAPARAGDARLLGARVRRPGLHDHRRERPRHLQRQHPRRSSAATCSVSPSCTSSAVGSAAAGSGPTPTCSIRRSGR